MSLKKIYINDEVNNFVHLDNLQADIQKEMEIILTTSHKCSKLLKEHHTYQNVWELLKGAIIRDEYCNKLQTELLEEGTL